VNYTYDNASRRATMTVVGQPQVVYTYDNANRLTTIVQGTSTVTIGYDDADRRTSVTYPNTNSITYGYNVASELTTVTYKKGATTLGTLTYTYDAAGNRLTTGGTFARTNLPPALATTTYNANNQQTAFGAATEVYDLNGNLATFTDASGTTTYTWNARNQMTSISGPSLTASFAYDSFGRRTGRTVNGVVINYVYDGLNPVQEKNGATVTANLLTGLGIDEFFTRTDSVGVRSLLPDPLGSTVALGDGTGTLQTQYTYEPFGFVSQTGAASTSSYKYTGREDDGTGLFYYRARYYQPRLQRFAAEDPIGLRGGINAYPYVFNNPLRFSDPAGQDAWAGGEGTAGVHVGPFGGSGGGGLLTNLSTGETCAFAIACGRGGIGIFVGAGGKFIGSILAPHCGKDAGGLNVQLGGDIIAPGIGGVGGSVGGGGGVGGGVSVGPEGGAGISVGIDVCYIKIQGCKFTPPDCQKCGP
jgi:RHS repeat-associated protein